MASRKSSSKAPRRPKSAGRSKASGPLDEQVGTGLELWRAAARWRRQMDASLAEVDLTFTQWVILLAADSVIRETKDAVSQAAISAESQVDKVTVSHVVRALEEREFVDRGPAGQGRSWRIWLTPRGTKALSSGTARVRAASSGSFKRLGTSNAGFTSALRQIAVT